MIAPIGQAIERIEVGDLVACDPATGMVCLYRTAQKCAEVTTNNAPQDDLIIIDRPPKECRTCGAMYAPPVSGSMGQCAECRGKRRKKKPGVPLPLDALDPTFPAGWKMTPLDPVPPVIRQSGPYSYRVRSGEVEEEITFATLDELRAYMREVEPEPEPSKEELKRFFAETKAAHTADVPAMVEGGR